MASYGSSEVARTRGDGAAGAPFPHGLAPMLAVASPLPADDDGWAFEFKWDGMRAIVEHDGREVAVASRRRTVTPGYPELAELAGALAGHTVVLDGEIVAFGDRGVPDFGRLQRRMGVDVAGPRLVASTPVVLLAFDLLYLDGDLLLDRPYAERRARLEALELAGPCWQVPPAHVGHGQAVMEASTAQGLEGVIAKRVDSRYEPGCRSRHWLKVKNRCRQELVVGGWLPGEGNRRNRIGSLLLGYWDDEEGDDGRTLRLAGAAGSGLKESDLAALARLLEPLRRPDNPFDAAPPRRDAVFVEPEVVVEIEFTEWTHTDTLRQPVFKGLRPDKAAGDVRRET